MSLPSFDDGDDSVYDVENETLFELSGFVLDSEFWCHESHGETFCSADPQVEGRSVLWTWAIQRCCQRADFERATARGQWHS